MKLCGYLGVTTRKFGLFEEDGSPTVGEDDQPVTEDITEARLYTSGSFDEWFVIPTDQMRHLIKEVDDDKRSLIWVDADATLTHCRLMDAADVAQSLSSGMDDPTAYPRGPRG